MRIGVLYFSDKSGINSATPDVWKTWARNPNHEPGIGCTRKPTAAPNAPPHALLGITDGSEIPKRSCGGEVAAPPIMRSIRHGRDG